MGLSDTPVMDSVDYARRLMFEPTLNINGFASGYAGRGIKTIVPARARLKMDTRLVAEQHPADIFEKFAAFVAKHAPGVSVKRLGAMSPSRTSPELSVSKTVVEAVRRGRNEEPIVYPALGGSLPESAWTGTLGVPSILVPYANADENNHAPNENMELEAFFNGIVVSAHVLDALGASEG
jgi:acetylornithine deacetylase/succinyl-diaminopimelate desuccinylase-like protein